MMYLNQSFIADSFQNERNSSRYPSWIRDERYDQCADFYSTFYLPKKVKKFFSLFKREK